MCTIASTFGLLSVALAGLVAVAVAVTISAATPTPLHQDQRLQTRESSLSTACNNHRTQCRIEGVSYMRVCTLPRERASLACRQESPR